MPCTVIHIDGPRQSGKTTMALAMLEKLAAARHPVQYLALTAAQAVEMRKRTEVPCRAWGSLAYVPVREIRAVVVDPVPADEGAAEIIGQLRKHLDAQPGPTQLILVREV